MQLYARVFVQILDSSIAEDFESRHVFEDMLKVCDMNGCIDVTRTALARRFNMPLDRLNRAIARLECADDQSRDPEFEGRRLARLDEHRDWGWRILNWAKYEAIRTRADAAIRQARHRAKKEGENGGVVSDQSPGGESLSPGNLTDKDGHPGTESKPPEEVGSPPRADGRKKGGRHNKPASVEECIEMGKVIGVQEVVCRDFWLYHEARAEEGCDGQWIWMTGGEENRVPVGQWSTLLKSWANNRMEFGRRKRGSRLREIPQDGPVLQGTHLAQYHPPAKP